MDFARGGMKVSVVLTLPVFILGWAVWFIHEWMCVACVSPCSGGVGELGRGELVVVPSRILDRPWKNFPTTPVFLAFPSCELGLWRFQTISGFWVPRTASERA